MKEDSPDKKIKTIFRANQQISIFFNAAKDSQKAREQEAQRERENKLQKEQEEKQLLVKAQVQEKELQSVRGPVQPKAQEQVQGPQKGQVPVQQKDQGPQKEQRQLPQKAPEQVQQKEQEQVQQKEQEQEQPKDQGQQIVYQSNIEVVTANNMEIAAPIKQGVPVFLEKGDNFLIRVRFRNETYEFKSSYIYRRIGQNPIWIIQTPYEGTKIQERVHIRINFPAVVKAWPIKKPETNIQYFGQPKSSGVAKPEEATILLIKDISAGGLRIISKLPYSLKSKLRLSFELPDYGEIKVLGQVLRVQTYQHEKMTLFFNGIKFLNITDRDFHALEAFISRKQNEIILK